MLLFPDRAIFPAMKDLSFSTARNSRQQDCLRTRLDTLHAQVEPLLVPGLFGSGPGHWQSRWEATYGFRRVTQKSWEHPVPEDWEAALTEAITRAATESGRRVLLVAHSLGAVLTVRWLNRHNADRIAGAFLVAPADIEHAANPAAARLAAFAPLPENPLPVPSALVFSRNDEWLSVPRARHLARKWRSDLRDAGQVGHIGSSDPLEDWTPGLKALLSFHSRHIGRPSAHLPPSA
ncbi:RBBP9/YdeN family alpha/beta hydrolase [Gluconobacter morbifer]|uniref:Hydrolase n=1 Tax=Gluconobacter morbifer G707 TaxID=1088869 RepID=G6XEZ5_9PROT|nr:alpha/beta fold hydrolase [Gluconobacter morbifer]EHH68753.1 hypothetical protein GMO_00600 [Gluconobacter morbifer G707]